MRRIGGPYRVRRDAGAGTAFSGSFDERAQRRQRAVGLALWRVSHHGAARERADGAERGLELVLIVEPRPSATALEPVLDQRLRARRAVTLPARERRRPAFDQPPVHADVGAAQMQHLLHLRALARRAGVTSRSARWIVTHSARRCGSITTLHTAPGGAAIRTVLETSGHRARPGSSASHSRSACSTAASKPCRRTRRCSRARASSASRSPPRLAISGPSSSLGVLLTRAANAVPSAPNALGRGVGRAKQQRGDALDHRAVGEHLRAGDVERLALDRARRRGGDEVGDGVALVDRLRAKAPPGGSGITGSRSIRCTIARNDASGNRSRSTRAARRSPERHPAGCPRPRRGSRGAPTRAPGGSRPPR